MKRKRKLKGVYRHDTECCINAIARASTGIALIAQYLLGKLRPKHSRQKAKLSVALFHIEKACRWTKSAIRPVAKR